MNLSIKVKGGIDVACNSMSILYGKNSFITWNKAGIRTNSIFSSVDRRKN
jgi:hypothetical protein